MAAGALTEEIVEEVATNLEEVAEVTRRLDPRALGFFFSGLGVGLAAGFYFGYKFNREKIRAEAFKESEAEVEAIREDYQRKAIAQQAKPELEEVIEREGYSVRTPDIPPRPLPSPVPIRDYTGPVIMAEPQPEPMEESTVIAEAPYVIHRNAFVDPNNTNDKTVYTYWAGDDVLTDTDNDVIPDAGDIVGRENLQFGVGSDNPDVVFVRNEKLQLDMEICRDPRSYEDVVLGESPDPEDTLRHSSQSRPAPKRRVL